MIDSQLGYGSGAIGDSLLLAFLHLTLCKTRPYLVSSQNIHCNTSEEISAGMSLEVLFQVQKGFLG